MRIYANMMDLDNQFGTNRTFHFALAIGIHLLLVLWNPIVIKAGTYAMSAQIITVKVMDHMPVIAPPAPKPVEKIEEPKPVPKAKKSGLSLSAKLDAAIARHRQPVIKENTVKKPFVSKLKMPKFVPRDTDQPIAASPMPGVTAPSSRRAISPMTPPPAFKGKTRGVRAQDIPFQLSDHISSGAGSVVAIPIGETRADLASLPSAPVIQGAPKGRKGITGYRYTPGNGMGSGELTNRDKSGKIGYHGMVKADTYVEGTLSEGNGDGKGRGKVVTGKGFEIGGPVGDRKIIHRVLPKYPAWAEEQGLSAQVKIYFTVKADGTIRSNMRILQSSGNSDLDELAKDALKQWRFSPTSAESTEDTSWGAITFRFTLA